MTLRWKSALVLALVTLTALPAAAHATLTFVRNPLNPVVFVAADDGSKQRRIGRGSDPRVSPNGKLVALMSPPRGPRQLPRLEVAPTDGSAPPAWLAGEMQYGETFAWSADSSKIAAVRVEEDGTERLTLIDLNRGTQRTVARGYFYGVSFDPGGEQIAYGQARKDRFPPRSDIRIAPVAGGTPVQVTRDHRSLEPLWGPTGQIVFVKQLGAKRRKYGPKNELFLMDADGGGVRRLTRTEVDPLLLGLAPTDWSADGRRLLAEFVGQDTSYAVTVNPRTGAQRALTGNPETGFAATALASGGGTVLGFTGGFEPGPHHDVVTVPYRGGKPRVLVRNASQPDWSR